MKKNFAALIVLILAIMPLSARTDLALEYSFFPANKSIHHISVRGEFYLTDSKAGAFGLLAEAGYGYRLYAENGSLARIYGPSISLGAMCTVRATEKLSFPIQVKASAVYALFPTVLWAEASMAVRYSISQALALNAGVGILFISAAPKARLFAGFVW